MAVSIYGNINDTYKPPKIDLFSLAKEHNNKPTTSFRDRLSLGMFSNMEAQAPDGDISLSEKEDALMNSFKSIADEISSGYEAGTRARYVQDDASEDGYRLLSKEEEISILQKEFDEFVNDRFGEKHQKEGEEVLKALNMIGSAMGNAWQKYYELEKIPADFIDGVIDSSRRYIEKL